MGEGVVSLLEGKETENDMLPFLSSAKVSSMSVDDVLREFRSDVAAGLVDEEADRRKRIYGLNEFDVGQETPLWRKYVDQVIIVKEAKYILINIERHNLRVCEFVPFCGFSAFRASNPGGKYLQNLGNIGIRAVFCISTK